MDTLKEMRGTFGRMHEFLLALEKAGFTEEIIVEIINSKGNQLAGEMFNSLPERLRTKWKMSDLNLIVKVNTKIIKKYFTDTLSNNDDEEIFMEKNRTLLSGVYDQKEDVDINCQVFHFNYIISNSDAIKEMKKQGCRPATEYETLTFFGSNPNWARNYKLCALGVIYKLNDYWYYPVFRNYNKHRIILEKHYEENDNSPSMRFLGVKIK